MRPFRFRAAAALDLRIKEEEAARLRLAQAEAAQQQADARARAADEAVVRAAQDVGDASRAGIEAWRLGWHQSWIRRQRVEAVACRRTAVVSAATVAHAAASVQTARQRRRALERLRDRAWRRHKLEADRHELREMNELATLRHTAQAADAGGRYGDD